MFSISPEDTLRQVMRYQDEQREQVARERLANAASAGRAPVQPGARGVEDSGWRDLWVAMRQRLLAITGRHAMARRSVPR